MRLFWSSHVYKVIMKRRSTNHWGLIKPGFIPYTQCFEVLRMYLILVWNYIWFLACEALGTVSQLTGCDHSIRSTPRRSHVTLLAILITVYSIFKYHNRYFLILQVLTCSWWSSVSSFHVLPLHLSFWLVGTTFIEKIWTRNLPGTKPICYQLSYSDLDERAFVKFKLIESSASL